MSLLMAVMQHFIPERVTVLSFEHKSLVNECDAFFQTKWKWSHFNISYKSLYF